MYPPFMRMQQVMQYIHQLRSNPSQTGEFLLQQGAITQQQFDEIQKMGIAGNPQAIGQYMMNRGRFTGQQADTVRQTVAAPLQNNLGQN